MTIVILNIINLDKLNYSLKFQIPLYFSDMRVCELKKTTVINLKNCKMLCSI